MDPVPVITNLGIAGFSIWVMYKMYLVSSARFKEKYRELIEEIDKTDRRNEDSEREFREYAKAVRDKTMAQMAENTKALDRVIQFLDRNI